MDSNFTSDVAEGDPFQKESFFRGYRQLMASLCYNQESYHARMCPCTLVHCFYEKLANIPIFSIHHADVCIKCKLINFRCFLS